MGNTFPDVVRFQKSWRPSQIAVQAHLERDLADGHMHVAVAPGGGKSAIGLEIIRRLDEPALILSPTNAASDRWKARFLEDFLPEGEADKKWVSQEVTVVAPIVSITYQALFMAMNIGRPIARQMQRAGVKTLCLDEPHHLRNEWWNMLEKLVGQMPELKIVALTSTPPRDVSETEWIRCLAMCGEVDREIQSPELVREGVLCPHQDYVYLCRPEEEAAARVCELRKPGEAAFARLRHDKKFLAAVQTHLGLAVPDAYEEFFLENPDYLLAILSYLKENGAHIPQALLGAAGNTDMLPAMTLERMDALLTGFLGYDRDSYEGAGTYQKQLEAELKAEQLISLGHVNLLRRADVTKALDGGREKLAAVEAIVRGELAALGDDLRMMVLTEHIKKEQMPVIGDEAKPLKDIGALPVFEALRRAEIEGLYLMVMTNTLMIIPTYLVPWFEEHTNLQWMPIKETGYSRLQFTADGQAEAVKWMTMMFEEGHANVMIGTPALFEEDWACRRVNSLVLATKVDSLATMNLMRGRAISADPEKTDKVTNIWHVATVDPDMKPQAVRDFTKMLRGDLQREPGAGDVLLEDGRISEDLENVLRHFYTFMGPHYDEAAIESGLERVPELMQPWGPERLEEFNRAMFARAKGREALRERWAEVLAKAPVKEAVTEAVVLDKKEFRQPARYGQLKKKMWIGALGIAVVLAERFALGLLEAALGDPIALGISLVAAALLAFWIWNQAKVLKTITPENRMDGLAHMVMEALQDGEVIRTPDVKYVVRDLGETWQIYLEGASRWEQRAFAACLTEFMGDLDDPEYLVIEQLQDGTEEYYPVPEMFGGDRDAANLFYRNANEYMGGVLFASTRTNVGRRLLKNARMHAYGQAGAKLARSKMIVKVR